MKNILSLLLTIGCLFAQANPVTMLVEPIPKSRAGEVAEIVISMNMDDEWHIYSIFKILRYFKKKIKIKPKYILLIPNLVISI